jgi:hypothetical protein
LGQETILAALMSVSIKDHFSIIKLSRKLMDLEYAKIDYCLFLKIILISKIAFSLMLLTNMISELGDPY